MVLCDLIVKKKEKHLKNIKNINSFRSNVDSPIKCFEQPFSLSFKTSNNTSNGWWIGTWQPIRERAIVQSIILAIKYALSNLKPHKLFLHLPSLQINTLFPLNNIDNIHLQFNRNLKFPLLVNRIAGKSFSVSYRITSHKQ